MKTPEALRATFLMTSLDFSDLELKIMAQSQHVNNPSLDIIREARDIHRVTASQMYGVDLKYVSPTMRNRAKQRNFKYLYSYQMGDPVSNIPPIETPTHCFKCLSPLKSGSNYNSCLECPAPDHRG